MIPRYFPILSVTYKVLFQESHCHVPPPPPPPPPPPTLDNHTDVYDDDATTIVCYQVSRRRIPLCVTNTTALKMTLLVPLRRYVSAVARSPEITSLQRWSRSIRGGTVQHQNVSFCDTIRQQNSKTWLRSCKYLIIMLCQFYGYFCLYSILKYVLHSTILSITDHDHRIPSK